MNQKDLGDLLQDRLLSINMEKKSENKHWNIPQISKNEVSLKKICWTLILFTLLHLHLQSGL